MEKPEKTSINTASAKIVVVDDEEIIRFTLQKKLSRLGYNVISLDKAEDALYLLKNDDTIDLLITDIKLRKMDGIELLRRVQGMSDPVPVIIITGNGNVEDAISALRYGAKDYIRKPFDLNDVASTVHSVIRVKREKLIEDEFTRYCRYEKVTYQVPVSPEVINVITFRLTRNLVPLGLCNTPTSENITLALQEAISNAMFHGNLDMPSEIREQGGIKAFNEEVDRRRSLPQYQDSNVTIGCEMTPDFVRYEIEDEGKGFDYSSLPDPRDPEHFFLSSGRGLFIIRIHMDEVFWENDGRKIVMIKNRIQTPEQLKEQ